jgi:hypothetical protein
LPDAGNLLSHDPAAMPSQGRGVGTSGDGSSNFSAGCFSQYSFGQAGNADQHSASLTC